MCFVFLFDIDQAFSKITILFWFIWKRCKNKIVLFAHLEKLFLTLMGFRNFLDMLAFLFFNITFNFFFVKLSPDEIKTISGLLPRLDKLFVLKVKTNLFCLECPRLSFRSIFIVFGWHKSQFEIILLHQKDHYMFHLRYYNVKAQQ